MHRKPLKDKEETRPTSSLWEGARKGGKLLSPGKRCMCCLLRNISTGIKNVISSALAGTEENKVPFFLIERVGQELLLPPSLPLNIVTCCLMIGTHSEVCVARQFHHCGNITGSVLQLRWP